MGERDIDDLRVNKTLLSFDNAIENNDFGIDDMHVTKVMSDVILAEFIDATSAGAIALITNCAGLSSQSTMSTRSPLNSPDTAWTREPRIPTQAPTGSKRLSLVLTAIFALEPGSRAAAFISNVSSAISGTSIRNSSTSISGCVRLINN